MPQPTKTVASSIKDSVPSTSRNSAAPTHAAAVAARVRAAGSQIKMAVQKNGAVAPRATHAVTPSNAASTTVKTSTKGSTTLPWVFDGKTRRYFCRRENGRVSWTKPVQAQGK